MAGWNKPSAANQPTVKKGGAKSPSAMKVVIVGLVVVCALGALCLWLFSGGEDAPKAKPEKGRGRIKEVTPAAARKLASKPDAKKERVKPKTVEEVVAQLDDREKPQIPKRVLTPERWFELTNRVFNTGTEQLMSWVFGKVPGDMPVPIPNISLEEKRNIASILISPIDIKETDDERLIQCKEQVALAKKEMAKYIGDGGDPDEFLQYYYQELKLAFDKRNDAIHQLQETKCDDPELAEDLREAINKKFEQDGIKLINKEEI